ncbi:hypothetical protein GO755_29610 [Spirosoma sp. HMF4905]|uniref:Uncharacterized protein n=1 Tax=Spirosoma arboris TaxID=2682092 RepID=A0A7K1SKE0_9BACT|nr:hypothetical protein [Spirosoma arboris]MVM34224.1 hypothetical protein [Spirosoma arboris]
MADREGLLLENQHVATLSGIATTYQGNDLTKPDSLQTNFSQVFDLPDSRLIRKLSQNAEQLDARSDWPYKPLSAMLIERGEIIFDGFAELTSFSGGWEVELYEEKKDLFARLSRSIRSANLAYLNHDWTIEQMNMRAVATEGICYPVIDYGLLRNGVQPPDILFPAIFVKTLINQMLQEEGYTMVGELPGDELYKRLLIPFSEDVPTSNDQQWQTDRFANVTMNLPPDTIDKGTLGGGSFIDRIQPYSIDNTDIFYQGKLHPFNTTTHTYACPSAMNLRVDASQIFKALCVLGGVEVILSVVKNGNTVASNRFEAGSGYNLLFLRSDRLTLSQTVKCKAGDRVQIRLEARRFTEFGAFRFEIYNDPDNSFVSFTPSLTTALGDTWLVSRNLPDITGTALMVAVAHIYGGTWLVNKRRRQIRFSKLSDTINNTSNVLDWSAKLNTGVQPGWVPRIDPYGQVNRLTWKETDESKAAGQLIGSTFLNYGDGVINVAAPVLEADVPLFEMPFAASTDSDQDLPGYGNPVFIKTRTVSGVGENLTINNQSTSPRLLLASLDDAVPVQTTRILDDGVTVEPVTVKLKPCWFGKRPFPAITNNTAFCLSFAPIPIARGEQALINLYYGGLKRVLRRMRVLTVSMYLKPADIASLDFSKLIRLQRVKVGALILSDQIFYLNKVENYVSGQPCQVTLIAF